MCALPEHVEGVLDELKGVWNEDDHILVSLVVCAYRSIFVALEKLDQELNKVQKIEGFALFTL